MRFDLAVNYEHLTLFWHRLTTDVMTAGRAAGRITMARAYFLD